MSGDPTHGSELQDNEFEVPCTGTPLKKAVVTCGLNGKWESSEPDCEQGSSTDSSDVMSTSQISTTVSVSPAGMQTDSSSTKGELAV